MFFKPTQFLLDFLGKFDSRRQTISCIGLVNCFFYLGFMIINCVYKLSTFFTIRSPIPFHFLVNKICTSFMSIIIVWISEVLRAFII